MVKKGIKEQISDIESVISKNPEYHDVLSLHSKILKNLLYLDESTKKGRIKSINKSYINDIVEKTIILREPMIDYINISEFNQEELRSLVEKIVLLFLNDDLSETGLDHLYSAIKNNEVSIIQGIKSFLSHDHKWFSITGERYNINPSLLLFIFSTPLQPFFQHLARSTEERFKEPWWESYCPVCGQQPNMAIKKGIKHYMVCRYCGIEYLFDMFKCINCENTNPSYMGFIKINESDSYELNYCENCKHYIKVFEIKSNVEISIEIRDILITEQADVFMKQFFINNS